MAQMYHFHMPL